MRVFSFCITLIFPLLTYAYPQMIRHGYTNCMTCHTSPRGGGQMTEYGRALSKEVLSTWGYEGEQEWHYGAIKKNPEWLRVGGDFRAAQVHTETSQATIGRFIRMQEQVEVSAKVLNTWLNITPSSDTLKKSRPWYLSQYYLLTQITDAFNVRIGRFVPRFGVNTPEHIFSTRGPIGFGYQSERDTVEFSYIEEKWDLSLAITGGQMRDHSSADGFYSQANYSIGTHDKLGISFGKKLKANQDQSFGLHALVGFTEHFYLITDSVFKDALNPAGVRTGGVFHFTKLGYEMEKGIHLIAIGDLKKSDISQKNQTVSTYGLGLTIFPRPHFEIQGVFAKQTNLSRGPKEGDYAWLMMHFYL